MQELGTHLKRPKGLPKAVKEELIEQILNFDFCLLGKGFLEARV